HVSYQVISKGKPPRLELRPAFHFRHHEAPVDSDLAAPYKLTAVDGRYEISAARRKLPPLRMQLHGRETAFTIAPSKIPQVVYRIEQQRGYAYEGELWSPGFFRVALTERSTATLVGSTEPWDIIDVLGPDDVLAAERERRARLLHDAIAKARQNFRAALDFAACQSVLA